MQATFHIYLQISMESSLNLTESPYALLLVAVSSIPICHYLLGIFFIFIVFLYNFLEFHFMQDLFTGFRGQPLRLSYNPASHVYRDVVSNCKLLHGRYLATPWLCSPHIQTIFLSFWGNPPVFSYTREIFTTSDGGTLALDWLRNGQVKKQDFDVDDGIGEEVRINPIIIVVPGLTSPSDSAYVKHLGLPMAKRGWDVVVSNHRGLGGVPLTSDCLYNGGRTEDLRDVIDHLHTQYPEAPLYVVGTSVGANILVKYLGEVGIDTPIVGAAAICCPWDVVILDRFLSRRFIQRLYSKALAIGLKDYAHLHEAVVSRLSNWEGVKKSRTLREFDDSASRFVGNYQSVDTYYRGCSSCNLVGNVRVPLLCINSLDDPVCTSEAIPWDDCRLNKNIVLAATQHGGHLSFFQGLTANTIWWVRAVDEFIGLLQSNSLNYTTKQVLIKLRQRMLQKMANSLDASCEPERDLRSTRNAMRMLAADITEHES